MTVATYTVSGMSCAHCVEAVSTEVGKLDGVNEVRVDLAGGRVTVEGAETLDDAAVLAAIDEAGYDAQRAS